MAVIIILFIVVFCCISIRVFYQSKKVKNNIKNNSSAREFDLVDLLLIPYESTLLSDTSNNISLFSIPIIRDVISQKLYYTFPNYTNYFVSCLSFIGLSNISIRSIKVGEINVGSKGKFYICENSQYLLKDDIEFKEKGIQIYNDIINEKIKYIGEKNSVKRVCIGQYCNINNQNNLSLILNEAIYFDGVIEFTQ